jgi:enoyl-CoA hydratase/carnithine racemase
MPETNQPLVRLDKISSVATLTLDRAERHNSLVPELLEQMLSALEAIDRDSSARAVVLHARGRSFSTGGDLLGFYEHLDDLPAYAGTLVGLLNRTILALVALPIPVVAAVHGIVTGGSLGLVLAADVVLVAPEASFTPFYGVVGFSPDGGWTAMLPAVIGSKRAAEVLLRNRTITAEQAVSWGLAGRVVPADSIRDEALTVAQEIATLKPGSTGYAKRLLGRFDGDLAARLEAERAHFVEQVASEEAHQGIRAFLERRDR